MRWILVVYMLTVDGPITERIMMESKAQCVELALRMSIPEHQYAKCVQEYLM